MWEPWFSPPFSSAGSATPSHRATPPSIRSDGAALWTGNRRRDSQVATQLGESVHATDCQGEEQRRQDEHEDGEGAGVGHGSLTFCTKGTFEIGMGAG